MFASTSTGGSICFRCQLILTRARLPPKRSGRLAPRAVVSPQARPNTTQAATVAEPSVQGPLRRRSRRAYPLGKIRGGRGNYVREESASLDTFSLGVPSEVIILRDAKINRSRAPRPISVHEEVEPLSAADMLSSVEAERELISAEDINNNIDKHRPAKTKHILAKKEFDGLAKELHDGFTVPQLTRYLENLEITVRSKAVKTLSGPKPTEELPVLERSAWTSGITPFVERKLDSGLYYDSGYLTRKQNLAIRVLRNGWNLKIKEEVDSIGELELRVTPQKLSLLLHEGRAFLKDFAKRYNARVDVSKTRGIVRITADQATARSVYQNIKKVLSNVARMEVDLQPLQALLEKVDGGLRRLRGSTRDKISELTGTEIDFSEDGRKLIIYYFGPKTTDAEDARRLFLASVISPKDKHPPITWDAQASENCGALCPPASNFDLSWKNRQNPGSRWTFPSTSQSSEEKNKAETKPSPRVCDHINNDLFSEFSKGSSPLQLPSDQVAGSRSINLLADTATVSRSSWDPKSRQVCSVLLGQILHEAQDDTSARHMKAEEVLKLQYKTMSSSISGALLTLQNLPIRKISESLYIRLLPSPWTSLGLGSMQAFPEVEMRVGLLGNDKRPFLQRVSAILEQKFSDVMLPEQRADLRFRREAFLDLANARKDEVVADFLAKSKLDTLGTGRLRAPANIKLHIPRWVIQEKGIDISNRITRESGIEEVEMDYLFSGLEYRHSLVLNWEAYRLEYNTIEAGKIGGRRTELHLVNEPRKATFSYLSRIPTNVDRFIASAYRLVNRLGKLASNEAIARNISSTRPLVREAKTPDYLDIYNTSRMLFDPSDDGSVLVQSSVQKAWAERELHDQDMVDEELADQDSVNADSVSNNAGGEDFHDENSVKKDLDVKAEPNDSNLQDVLGKETSD